MSRFDHSRDCHLEQGAFVFAERSWVSDRAPEASTSELRVGRATRATNDAPPLRPLLSKGGLPTFSLITVTLLLVALTACRQDMQDQPRYNPLRESDFFSDQRSSRPLVPGTVPRGDLRADTYYYTGFVGKEPGNQMPFPVTRQVLERGRERYTIYCAPCHSRTGDGNGMIVQRGYRRPPSYHIDRLRNAPLGHFFDVITNGFGAMPDYAAQVQPADRWAIVAYIRALQFSQAAPASIVPAGEEMPSLPPRISGTPGSGATPVPSAPYSGQPAQEQPAQTPQPPEGGKQP